jgi:hypothetical protein
MTAMNTLRIAYIVCSATTAACALVAAGYWYLSSRPAPAIGDPPVASISDAPELHIMNAQSDVYAFQAALAETSRLNKKAAVWSAIAALFGAAAAILGIA